MVYGIANSIALVAETKGEVNVMLEQMRSTFEKLGLLSRYKTEYL